MRYSPVELRHVKLKRGLLGYARGPADRLLADAVSSFEEVWRDRGELTDRVDQLERELARHRDLESLLRTTLVSAERAAHELKDQAKREAEIVLADAHASARAVTAEALAERERLRHEAARLRGALRAALECVSDDTGSDVRRVSRPETASEPHAA